MSNQMSVFEDLTDEKVFYHHFHNHFIEVLHNNHAPHNSVDFKKTKSGYYSYTYRGNIVFRVRFGLKVKWMEIPAENKSVVESCGFQYSPKKDFIRIDLRSPEDAIQFRQLLCDVLDNAIDSYPKTFSCCSRYLECSDTKKCVQPDQNLAMDCSYRVNLKRGKIFHGKNRTVQ